MKFRLSKLFWVGTCGIILTWSNLLYAFMGDYNSVTGNDIAVMGGYKNTEIDYKDKDDNDSDSFNVERQVLFIGVRKTMNTKFKLFGGFNYVINGEWEDTELDYDSGYSLVGGADYTFFNKNNISVSGFGLLDYILKDDWDWFGDETFASGSIEGYELSAGAMGKYNFNPNFSVFTEIRIVPLSDLVSKLENDIAGLESFSREIDIERDKMFGFQTGVMYDGGLWFVKGTLYLNTESGFGVSGGMKF